MLNKKNYTEPKISPSSHSMKVDWYVWFRIFDSDKNQWIQKRFKSGINNFKTLKERLSEANALKQVLKEELAAGWSPLQPQEAKIIKIYSIAEAMKYLVEIKGKTTRKKTTSTYKHITSNFVNWCQENKLADMEVKAITPAMAQQYMDYLLMAKNYSGRTFNDHLIILRTFFNCMIERGWCDKNPFRSVKKKEQTTGRNLAFTDDEKQELWALLRKEDIRMYYLTKIMYFCFIRRTEMIRLKVSDFDLDNNTIVIRGEVSKNKTQESVIIPKGLESTLREMRIEHYPPDYYVFGRYLHTSDVKFCNENHVTTRHSKFARRLGIDKQKNLYSWKHTGACKAYYATNKDIYSLMRQLRHRDLNTTMIYLKSLGLIQNDTFRLSMVS